MLTSIVGHSLSNNKHNENCVIVIFISVDLYFQDIITF